MDRILVRSMRFSGRVGCSIAERELRHPLEVDVELHVDLKKPGITDRLQDSLDYAEVFRRVKAVVEKREYHLLESVANEIAVALDGFGHDRLVVRVRKPNPSFGGEAAYSEVQIER